MALFEVNEYDKKFYENNLRDFLPNKIIDFHSHVYIKEFLNREAAETSRNTSWPDLVAEDNSIDDIKETYELFFPDKSVTPLMFSNPNYEDNLDLLNGYVAGASYKEGYPSLLFTRPTWSEDELEERLTLGNFKGIKPYLCMSDPSIDVDDIQIFDFLPHHHLSVMNKYKMPVVLHIPRAKRLCDKCNLEQIIEIREKYPDIPLDIAHVGRAYAVSDIGEAFEILKPVMDDNLYFDISANSNSDVFDILIKNVSAKNILFGSDLPILRMRNKRIVENNTYINVVPKGLYGDLSNESHMREADDDAAKSITFFMYEEINAFKLAAEKNNLSENDINNIFYGNAARILNIDQ